MKRFQFLTGFLCGALLFCGLTSIATAASGIMAKPSAQTFYLNGQRVEFEAYAIHGNNFVKLRDIGKAVDFGVTYDGTTNSVHLDPDAHYQDEAPTPTTPPATPSALTEENVKAILWGLMDQYPSGTLYGAPYIPNKPFDRPFSNCDACAGWAMKCSDAAFGDLPYRQVVNPSWDEIRAGDIIDWRTGTSGHAVVVLEKTDEYIITTESGTSNEALWGGQYFKWWLEEQPGYRLFTRYPQ